MKTLKTAGLLLFLAVVGAAMFVFFVAGCAHHSGKLPPPEMKYSDPEGLW